MKKDTKKNLKLNRETVLLLNEKSLKDIAGGGSSNPQECFCP